MFHKPIDEMFPNPPAGLDAHALREDAVPQHVAVIMDGNGRWAKKRALNRLKGHKAGIAAVRELIRAASDGRSLPYHLFFFDGKLETSRRRSRGLDGPVRQNHAR